MALFHITIEKVVVKEDDDVKKLLCEINKKLDRLLGDTDDDEIKQQMMDKLNSAIEDIKSTIK